jgi:serine/threonine-protein kinase
MKKSSSPDDAPLTAAVVTDATPSDVGLGEVYDEYLPQGSAVGDYIIEEAVSQGGFASVYRAHHGRTGAKVALKVLWRELLASTRLVRRFEHEAKALLKLRHPNIVEVLEYGSLPDGRPYFAMEWLAGRTLRDVIRTRGPMSPGEALAALEDIGAALAAAHGAGVIHRDLKAQNIMVMTRPDGVGFVVKLVDFGIAKVLEPERIGLADFVTTSTILGTPFYMAPEQILGQAVDQRTDIYALGLLLYEMVTGDLPFRGETRVEVEEMHLHAPPPRASAVAPVSAAFDGVIGRCLEKDPQQRFPTVADLLADLRVAVRAAPPVAVAPHIGVAVHFDARIDPDLDEVPLDAFDDVDNAMAEARRACVSADLSVDMESANSLLALALLSDAPGERLMQRERVVRVARDLAIALGVRDPRSAHVKIAITVHAAPVVVRRGDARLDFVEGDLLQLGVWASGHPGDGLCATTAAVEGLEHKLQLESVTGRADLLVVH